MHDFPVTAVAPLPPTQELYLPYVPANYKGYTCSSSADYTISLMPIQKNGIHSP